jgi:hypothetical protein
LVRVQIAKNFLLVLVVAEAIVDERCEVSRVGSKFLDDPSDSGKSGELEHGQPCSMAQRHPVFLRLGGEFDASESLRVGF